MLKRPGQVTTPMLCPWKNADTSRLHPCISKVGITVSNRHSTLQSKSIFEWQRCKWEWWLRDCSAQSAVADRKTRGGRCMAVTGDGHHPLWQQALFDTYQLWPHLIHNLMISSVAGYRECGEPVKSCVLWVRTPGRITNIQWHHT